MRRRMTLQGCEMPSVFVASEESRRRKRRWIVGGASWLAAGVVISAAMSGWVTLLGAAAIGALALPVILARLGNLSPARWMILALFFLVLAVPIYVMGDADGEAARAVPFHAALAFSALMVPSCLLAAAVHKVRA